MMVGVLLMAAMPSMASVGPESDPNDVYWDNPFALPGTDGVVRAIAKDASGNVYVGGAFSAICNVSANNVAKWDGTGWSALDAGTNDQVWALAVDGSGNLYAGGYFTSAGGVLALFVAKWNGVDWSALEAGMTGGSQGAAVYALAVDASGNLYAGGQFLTAGGVQANRLAKWNGTSWSALITGIWGIGQEASVRALAVDGSGNLYAGGVFSKINDIEGTCCVAKWNGTTWSALGAGLSGQAHVLALDGAGNLYVGGGFETAGGVSAAGIAKWNGTAWSALGSGTDNSVQALAVDGAGSLYAGGEFLMAGGASANHVAKWNGTAWSALGTGANYGVCVLVKDDSGDLFTGGYFDAVGGVTANHIAKWNGDAWSVSCAELGLSAPSTGGWYEEGERLQLSVSALNAIGTVTYQWSKEGVSIEGATLSTLLIDSLTLADSGYYTCQATDESYAAAETTPVLIRVFSVGSLPATGIAGMAFAIGCFAIAGVRRIRKK